MTFSTRFLASTFGLITLITLAGASASAQCGAPAKKISFSTGASAHALLKQAAFTSEPWNYWGDERDQFGMEPIVGLWKITFTDSSKGYSDTGYAAWHSDFTEFQNSERVPSTGAVCQGVWEKIGRSTYRLNHFALGYADSATLTNVIRIREEITVDRSHQSFYGTFTTDIYDTKHNLQVEFKGPITGKRITMDTGIESQD